MYSILFISILLLLTSVSPQASAGQCHGDGVYLRILGSGGPELDDGRASSGYLIGENGRARVIVDMGAGTLSQYEQSSAHFSDLEFLLLTHLHVDHSADLPALVKGAFFTSRERDLPVYGPGGNHFMPGTSTFLETLFNTDTSAYAYLSDHLTGRAVFLIRPEDIPVAGREVRVIFERPGLLLSTVPVHHGPVPALAWRIDISGKSITISGDMNGEYETLQKLAAGTDILVAHHAIPEAAGTVAKNLHMPPSAIGKLAADVGIGHLILSHRMQRTLGREQESTSYIRQHYKGPLTFAEDGQCFPL